VLFQRGAYLWYKTAGKNSILYTSYNYFGRGLFFLAEECHAPTEQRDILSWLPVFAGNLYKSAPEAGVAFSKEAREAHIPARHDKRASSLSYTLNLIQ
jgi:hypothetical protein